MNGIVKFLTIAVLGYTSYQIGKDLYDAHIKAKIVANTPIPNTGADSAVMLNPMYLPSNNDPTQDTEVFKVPNIGYFH